MSDIHAKTCSPSGAEGWFACPGRIVMEAPFPDEGSAYSDDGTARHLACGDALRTGADLTRYVGYTVAFARFPDEPPAKAREMWEDFAQPPMVIDRRVTYKSEWVDEDQDYVDTIRALAEGGELFVEQQVNFEQFTEVPGDSFGTADAIILKPLGVPEDGADLYELIVADRKTGWVEVDVERNKQLMLYALGAYAAHGLVYDIARVRLIIHQRKAVEWDCSIDELLAFGEQARAAAQRVTVAIKMHGAVDPALWAREYLNPAPSEDACRYCKAMATCPSMQAAVEAATGADFDVIDPPGNVSALDVELVPALNDDYLGTRMAAVGVIEAWCEAVRAEVRRRLLAGQQVAGYGLELGKQGSRAWRNKDEALKLLRETFRLPIEVACDLSVISPTSAEKLTKGEKPAIGPRQWQKAQALITRADAQPAVKPLAAIRTPYTPPSVAPADDFAPVNPEQTADTPVLDLC